MNDPILSLRVARFNDEPVAEPIAVEFGPAGGTIGRATDCTLVLPDQQRAISRVHARIEFRGGEYLLCDLGSNPSVLNQRALGGTREARLANGDRLMIGTYLLEVTIAERVAGVRSVTGLSDPLAAVKVLGGPLPADGQGDPFGLGSLDPLGQPAFGERAGIASGPRYAGSESDHVAPEFQAFSAPVAAPRAPAPASAPPIAPGAATPTSSGIPADYDPLADVLAQWEKPAQPGGVPAGAAHTSPLFAPSPSAPSNASAFTSNFAPAQALAPQVPASQNGPTGLPQSLLDGPVGGAATPFDDLLAPSANPLIPEDLTEIAPASSLPDAARSARVAPAPAQPAVQQPSPTQREPEPAPAAMAAPAPKASAPAPAVQPEPAPPRAAVPDGDTFAALLEGLGLDPSRAPNLPPAELARLVGMMLREALRGTMAVLRARSMTRREARLDVTLIVARDNNPLKFFPDVDSALAQMLTGRGAGYLPPAEALERAFDDIESHELAVIVGMRAGLAEVLGRFDPASIEAQLKAGGVIDKVLSNRKAKLWDLFVERQADVSREAEDDFQRLFGKAFNDAYEAQIDALHAARKSGKTDPTSHH
ncbi:type VI secretion system-associated FHA domain protein TagH [Paraburkholderia hospita]|uniref:type VI secretion system-associated FHA domain protein TagH n=1 Tax=Paraburkholderia hospita TaxID=169430 RepID=UPI0009A69838|nr:type VI secretion system-associated FHA domain protein TagH [Paraburkholderia hospita]AXF03902.1 type VI secretion system-associated FHA domain protein TagH [Paraburkholderia hospita]SKD01034.1 FHA domain protein [Paraburkholderia hospita]SKD01217.1 FHA domain protein [Burkholderia sp. CF099]SOE84109.1 FHA domain protein [Burkholderia sp. YR290]